MVMVMMTVMMMNMVMMMIMMMMMMITMMEMKVVMIVMMMMMLQMVMTVMVLLILIVVMSLMLRIMAVILMDKMKWYKFQMKESHFSKYQLKPKCNFVVLIFTVPFCFFHIEVFLHFSYYFLAGKTKRRPPNLNLTIDGRDDNVLR